MAEIGSAFLSILPSAKGFGSKLESEVGGETKGAGKKVGASFGGAFKAGALGLLGGGAVAGVFLKGAISDAREAQKVTAATTAIIKATGGAAKVSAGQVGDLAGALAAKTGVDDGQIQAGENLLLTFKNVKKAGEGLDDIFGRATEAGLDLAAAGFGSVEGNAVQLGKALNDPLKGIAALSKSGVTFTEGQKEQIKGFVKSNDLLSAQKIILGEVEAQVGGTAEATATSGEKAAYAFGELKESIGTALLPVIDKLQTAFVDKIAPAIAGFIAGIQDGTGAGGTFADVIRRLYNQVLKPVGEFIFGTIVPAIAAFVAGMRDGTGPGGKFAEFIGKAYDALRAVAGFIVDRVVPAIAGFIGGMKDGSGAGGGFADTITKIKNFITQRLVPAIQGIVDAVRNFVKKALPIAIEFVQGMRDRLGPLVPKIKEIFTKIGNVIIGALEFIKTFINAAIVVIQFIWQNFGQTIMNFVAGAFSAIATIISGALSVVQGIIKVFTSLIKGDWSGVWNGFKMIVQGAWDVISGIVSLALTSLKAVLSAAWTVIKAGVSAAWNGIKSVISSLVRAIVSDVTSKVNAIKRVANAAWNAIKGAASAAWNGVKSAISSAINAARGVVSNQVAKIKTAIDGLSSLVSKVSGIFGKIVRAIRDKMESAVSFMKGIPGKLVGAVGDLGRLLYDAGARLIGGLIDGISSKISDLRNKAGEIAGLIADKFPGSPVKSGPLKSWNRGSKQTEAGRKLAQGIADGLKDKRQKVIDAARAIAEGIRGQIATLKDDMRGLSQSVADAFKPDLLSGNLSDLFSNGAAGVLNIKNMKKAFLKLRKFGLGESFISDLFASGNSSLIAQLASGTKKDARSAQYLYGQNNLLSNQLGNAVARNEFGDNLDHLGDRLERALVRVEKAVKRTPESFAKEINGAARNGRRKARA